MSLKLVLMIKKRFLTFLLLALISWLALPAATPTVPGTPPAVEQPPAQPPTAHEAVTNYENAFVKMLVTLLVLVALIFFTVWMLRRLAKNRLGLGAKGRSITILERKPLSQKSMLYLIEIGEKQILIAESQVEVRALATLGEEPPSPSETTPE